MKKWLLMVVAAVFCAWNVQAQTEKGAMAVGGSLSFGFGDDYSNIGIGAKYQYNIIDNLRLEPSVNYYFKKDNGSMWDLCANVQYLFTLNEGLNFYPLAGIGVAGAKIHAGEWSNSSTAFAFNIGAGFEYMFTSNVSANVEYKYRVCSGDFVPDRSLLTLGVAYHF